MAEEKKESWLNYLALTTVILAVCATLSTFKGGGYSTRSVLSQSQEANQWSYYQSKSIKGYLHEIEHDSMELQLKAIDEKQQPDLAAAYKNKLTTYEAKMKKYEEEKAEIIKKAQEFERVKLDAQTHSQTFGMAVIFLQIAILLSSIAALIKRKSLWFLGMATGSVGIFFFVNGFFLLGR